MSCLREQPSSCNPLSWSSYSYIIIHSLHLILRRWQHVCWPALPYSSFTKRLHRRGPVGLCHLYPLVLFPSFPYVWHVRILLRSRWLFDAAADDNDDDVCIHTLGHWADLQKIDFQGSQSRRREQSWDVMCKSHTDDYPSWHPLIVVGGEAVKFARMPALWELWAWCHVWKRCPKDMLTTGWLPQMQNNWLNIERTNIVIDRHGTVMIYWLLTLGRYFFGDFFFFFGHFFFLVLWSPGPPVLRSPGPLVPWCSGPLVLRSSGPPVPWSPGPPVLLSSGPLVLWSPGPLV